MDNPDISLWRQRNHQLDDLPIPVKGFVREQLKLPAIYAEKLLPGPRISVSSGRDAAAYSNTSPTHSFNPSPPINDIETLKQVILPPKGLVAKLLIEAKQCWLDSAESLTLPGVSHNLPLWALNFWSDLHLIVYPARVSWEQALTWLQRDDLNLFPDQVRSTCEALTTVSWSGNLPALSTDRTQFTKSTLLNFLSRSWLSDEEIDLMIYFLEAEVKLTLPNL